TASAAGSAALAFRYANGTATDRPMDISVNGTTVASGVSFPATTDWDTWTTKTINANVNAGTNTIRATATTANGGPNPAYLDADLSSSTHYQAEDATISQGTVATNHLDYTGSGFVDYTNITPSRRPSALASAATATAALPFRYANGTTTDRPMDISVNGT